MGCVLGLQDVGKVPYGYGAGRDVRQSKMTLDQKTGEKAKQDTVILELRLETEVSPSPHPNCMGWTIGAFWFFLSPFF